MKLRLAIICTKGHWEGQAPQSEERIHEVIVEIPDLDLGWEVQRVMVCELGERDREGRRSGMETPKTSSKLNTHSHRGCWTICQDCKNPVNPPAEPTQICGHDVWLSWCEHCNQNTGVRVTDGHSEWWYGPSQT